MLAFPAPQVPQTDEPVAKAAFPALHRVQELDSAAAEKDPLGHEEQDEAFAMLNFPAPQVPQTDKPEEMLALPALHRVQELTPDAAE